MQVLSYTLPSENSIPGRANVDHVGDVGDRAH